MAHELDTNAATGKAAMFSVKLTPWHREGILLAEAPSLDDALRIGGLDFEVATRPVFAENGGRLERLSDALAIYRTDRADQTLGGVHFTTVGADYEPVQNADDAVSLSNKAKSGNVLLRVWSNAGDGGSTRYLVVDSAKRK